MESSSEGLSREEMAALQEGFRENAELGRALMPVIEPLVGAEWVKFTITVMARRADNGTSVLIDGMTVERG